MADLGCAQDANGNLLSPSKIKWYNDIDDVDPISGGSSATSHPTLSSLAKLTMLNCFFTTSSNLIVVSADKVAGSCQSNCVTRLSMRVVDPNNAKAPTLSVSLSLKRKASTCYEWTARIMRQLFPGKLLLELRIDSIHRGASFWNRV